MKRPKLIIAKRIILNERGHFRHYHPLSGTEKKDRKHGRVTISLDEDNYSPSTKKTYFYLNIQTERQLVWWVYENFGEGTYLISARPRGVGKGRKFYTFWAGDISKEGYKFQPLEYDKREINKLKKDLEGAESEEERQMIEKEINEFKDLEQEDVKARRYGLSPFLRSSGRRGEFHLWSEPDEGLTQKKIIKYKGKKKKFDEMTLDEINEV